MIKRNIGSIPAMKQMLFKDIQARIAARALLQGEIARLLGMHQPDVSNLVHERVERFSLDRLVVIVELLGGSPLLTL